MSDFFFGSPPRVLAISALRAPLVHALGFRESRKAGGLKIKVKCMQPRERLSRGRYLSGAIISACLSARSYQFAALLRGDSPGRFSSPCFPRARAIFLPLRIFVVGKENAEIVELGQCFGGGVNRESSVKWRMQSFPVVDVAESA